MSVNSPLSTLTVKICVAACAPACTQTFGTVADDPRKAGVVDYPFALNIAAQIVDAYTIGAPARDGTIVLQKNGGAEQRNLGLLSNLRNDITNNRRPTPTIAPMSIAPGDKVTVYLISNGAVSSVTAKDTLYLTVVTAPVTRNVNVVPRGPAGLGGLGSFLRAR